jgi:hypothetical protein
MNKESSLLTIKTESRDRLYFDQWEYAFSFRLMEAHTLRVRDARKLNDYVSMRMGWSHWQQRYTARVVADLQTALTHINTIAEPFKLVVSGHWGTIYTNHVNLANDFVSACPCVSQTRIKQAVVDRPRDTVLLMDPKHSIRSYFKSQWFPAAKISGLREFFAAQEGAIVPSQAMRDFLKSTGQQHDHWFPNYYYVDYDDPRYATMLAMIMPRCFRKTMSVVQRINS